MDRQSIQLALAVDAVPSGGLVTAVLSLGWCYWPALLGVRLTFANSRRIKRHDPDRDATKIDRVDGVIPDPAAPEG